MQGDKKKSGVPSPEEGGAAPNRESYIHIVWLCLCSRGDVVCVCFGVVTAENYMLPKLLKKLEIECL